VNKSEQWTISTKQQFTSSSWITYREGKDGVERSARSGASVKRSGALVCFGAGGSDVLRVKRPRLRVKRLSDIEGEAVEAMACSEGEAVKGVLRRQQCAPGVGGIEVCSVSGRGGGGGIKDLKRASGENLLSVEWAAHAPDIFIGGQMRDARSVRCIAHFSGASCIIFR
jgi:hypothetical protein